MIQKNTVPIYYIQNYSEHRKTSYLNNISVLMKITITKQNENMQKKIANYLKQHPLQSPLPSPQCVQIEDSDSQYRIPISKSRSHRRQNRKAFDASKPLTSLLPSRDRADRMLARKIAKLKQSRPPKASSVQDDADLVIIEPQINHSAAVRKILLSYEEDISIEDITNPAEDEILTRRKRRKKDLQPDKKVEEKMETSPKYNWFWQKMQESHRAVVEAENKKQSQLKEQQRVKILRSPHSPKHDLTPYQIEVLIVSDRAVVEQQAQLLTDGSSRLSSQPIAENLYHKESFLEEGTIEILVQLKEEPIPSTVKHIQSKQMLLMKKKASKGERKNILLLSLLDLVQQLYYHSWISQAIYQKFISNHSTIDIKEFLHKFKKGQLNSFNFDTIQFTLLDHRRIGQILLKLYPMEFKIQRIHLTKDHKEQEFLANSYQLTQQQYYRLYRKIDKISGIQWWKNILMHNQNKFRDDLELGQPTTVAIAQKMAMKRDSAQERENISKRKEVNAGKE